LDNNSDTTGEMLQRHLSGAKVVKAFNAILQGDLETDPRPRGAADRRALPLAGDDADARAKVAALIDQFGFDPLEVGRLAESWRFERGKPGYCIRLDRAGMAEALAAAKRGEVAPTGSWRRKAAAEPATEPSVHAVAGRGLIDIVDSQIHFGPVDGVDGTIRAMDALGIQTLIADELWDVTDGIPRPGLVLPGGAVRPLSILAQEGALRFPQRIAYVQRVLRQDSDLERHIPTLRQSPGCVGLRVVFSSRKERQAFVSGEWDRVFALALENNLPVALLTAELPELARIAKQRFPALRLSIDHCGWASSEDEWLGVLGLSDLSGVVLKWAHAGRTFRHFDDSEAAERRGLVEAVGAFGADRICWASDVTYEESRKSWAELLGSVRFHPDLDAEQRGWVLAGTARQFYNLQK
jgi:predicted TIM-barrel fold metal-dependent hydrolase